MNKYFKKSIVIGFGLGAIFFAIAPLGLGLTIVEVLRPVLIPGVYIVQLFGVNTVGATPLILSLILNGLIYSTLVMAVSLAFSQLTGSKSK